MPAHHVSARIVFLLAGLAIAATAASAADLKSGKNTYDISCKSCHGTDGTPNAGLAKMLKVEIPDLKSAAVQGMTDDEIKKIITDGKGKMVPIHSVSGAALDNVVAYVRSLKK